MAKLVETLIPLIALLLLLALANTARSLDLTTFFNYSFDGGERPTTLTYQRDAHFASDSNFLQLTYTRPNGESGANSAGRVLHNTRLTFKRAGGLIQADFETTFKFIIRPNAGDSNPGDGLAFFIAPVGSTVPESSFGGNLGIFGADGNAPNLFAVEFDTSPNEDWDPSFRHIGIDLGSRISSSVVAIDDGFVGQEVTAFVSYAAATQTITVRAATSSRTLVTAMRYDLGSLLQDQVQVGLSAATGYLVARHEIISWNFTTTISLDDPAPAAAAAAHIRQIV